MSISPADGLRRLLRLLQVITLLLALLIGAFLALWIIDADRGHRCFDVGPHGVDLFFDNTYLSLSIYSPSDKPVGIPVDQSGWGWSRRIIIDDGLAPDWRSRGQWYFISLDIWFPIAFLNTCALLITGPCFMLPQPAWLARIRIPRANRNGFPIREVRTEAKSPH